MFSCEFLEIFKNNIFKEYLRWLLLKLFSYETFWYVNNKLCISKQNLSFFNKMSLFVYWEG